MGKKYITEKPAKYGRKRFRKEISIPNPLRISFHFQMQIKDSKKVKPKITIPCQPVKTKKAFLIACQPTNLIIQINSPIPRKRESKKSKKFLKFILNIIPKSRPFSKGRGKTPQNRGILSGSNIYFHSISSNRLVIFLLNLFQHFSGFINSHFLFLD